jgi:hypothetical protein
MTHTDFIDRMNHEYFDGALAPAVLAPLRALPVEREDARGFVERTCRLMRQAGLPAADVSPFQGELLGSLIARLLPGTWGGRIPPITVAGRHRKFDELVARVCGARGRLLDVACGFPPFTSVDTATALPGWEIVGVDRSLPEYLVEDGQGSYAVFDAAGRAQYFQPTLPTKENWQALLNDPEASERRFEALLQQLLANRGVAGAASDGASLSVHPVAQYERANLRFVRSELDALTIEPADVVRCFNMLMYFDDAFRQQALRRFAELLHEGGWLLCGVDWALSIECRYTVYRKRDGVLSPGEFAFSLDNLTPIGIVPWYTLQPDDRDASTLASLCRVLRDAHPFMDDYTAFADALRLEYGVCPRQPDGYFGDLSPDIDPADVWQRSADFSDRLDAQFAGRAAEVLAAAGHAARVNEVGHVAVVIRRVHSSDH